MKHRTLQRFTGAILILFMVVSSDAMAGARGIALGMTNITQGKQSKECKRLFELFQMDANAVYIKATGMDYPWTQEGSKIKVIPAAATSPLFNKMILLKKQTPLAKICQQQKLWDGIIVFEYDASQKKVRLKLFDSSGKELGLIKVPIQPDGPMKNSLLKHKRRAMIRALGGLVEFSP